MGDIESDLSAFHRIDPDDIEDMTAARFFSFAERLISYKGALRHTAQDENNSRSSSHRSAPKSTTRDTRASSTYNDVQDNQELAPYFDQGEG